MLAFSEEQSGKLFPCLFLQEWCALFLIAEGSWAMLGMGQGLLDSVVVAEFPEVVVEPGFYLGQVKCNII